LLQLSPAYIAVILTFVLALTGNAFNAPDSAMPALRSAAQARGAGASSGCRQRSSVAKWLRAEVPVGRRPAPGFVNFVLDELSFAVTQNAVA